MNSLDHQPILRKDYLPPPYLVKNIDLTFRLQPEATRVTAVSTVYRNEGYPDETVELALNGCDVKLLSVVVDGEVASVSAYQVTETHLILYHPPKEFTLEIITEINPLANTTLSGLYQSSGNFCTQCEAEGFRRITYFLDRPDVLATYTTRIEAAKNLYPVLLSNGNCIETGELDEMNHYAVWRDPFPKPSYLFALVAGKLVCREDYFTTQSGKRITLHIFVEQRNKEKCSHAMASLKKAMKWDEEKYGLEYDLDVYMIVAVDDFNMGAMENKGLNIFNSKYVLAQPESATDQDYLGIEGVVAHEYFHNWTGNRVTCRDWFQLSLKEGLTVFRDQEFSADMNSRAVKRICDVKVLRDYQFREDAGPMAHPVRPDSYVEINNFYTVTVYNKGAEIIRMLRHLVGKKNFYKSIELYLKRFDGMAVTCDDFVDAMADASMMELEQFKLWYSQSGTPQLRLGEKWNEQSGDYTITIEQLCRPTPGQESKKPFHIPVNIGLLEPVKDTASKITDIKQEKSYFLELTESKHRFTYTGFSKKPVLSFLRGFTAPVRVEITRSRQELAFLMTHDTDLFNRWDAAFSMSTGVLQEIISLLVHGESPTLDPLYIEAFRTCLFSNDDMALTAEALTLPSQTYLAQQMKVVDPECINSAVSFVKQELTKALRDDLHQRYAECKEKGGFSITNEAIGRRSLKNCCLSYLMTIGVYDEEALQLCLGQFNLQDNMTDVIAALSALSHIEDEERERVFADFYMRWRDDPLVVDKWFALQACSGRETTLRQVKELLSHEAFSLENPNKVRALIGAFCGMNHHRFHEQSGEGYRFLSEQILAVDKKNPQVAARLVAPFINFAKYSQKLKSQMEEQLRFILMRQGLSADVYEVVKKSIDNQ